MRVTMTLFFIMTLMFAFGVAGAVAQSPIRVDTSLPANVLTSDPAGTVVTFVGHAYEIESGLLLDLPVSCTPTSGSFFPVGTTTVTCSTTDGSGHTVSGSSSVRVIYSLTPVFQTPRHFAVPGEVDQVTIGDFNRDGKPDMATTGTSGTYVLLGDGSGNFSAAAMVNGTPSWVITTGDFNGDGKPDLVNGSAQVFLGDGNGAFSTGPTLGLSRTRGLAVADFDHDNKLDLVRARSDSGDALHDLFVQYGDGMGGFARLQTMAVFDSFVAAEPLSIAVGDFNGDGYTDLAASAFSVFGTASGGYATVFLNDAAGNLAMANWSASAEDLVTGDFNRDGKLDLAGTADASEGPATASAGFGDGTGAFTNFTATVAPYWAETVGDANSLRAAFESVPPKFLSRVGAVADFNFDGIPDLALSGGDQTYDIYKGSILLGAGDGSFVQVKDFNAGSTAYSTNIRAADLNLDGKPDIVISNWQDSSVTVFMNATLTSTAVTQPGADVVAQTVNADLTFDNVTSSGTTSVTTIDPATVGDVPGGFAVADLAFEVQTTATFTGQVTSCFNVTTVNNESDFNSLRVLHLENGSLVDRTSSHDFANRKICATTVSFSPFYLATVGKKVKSLFDRSKAFKSGSTVPVKVQVLNGSDTNISSATLPLTARALRRIGTATALQVEDAGNSNPDYVFRYDSSLQGYIFNLKTTGLSSGKYVLSFYAGSDRTFIYTVTFEVR